MMIDRAELEATRVLQIFVGWLTSPQFYAQIGAIILAVAIAGLVCELKQFGEIGLAYWVSGTNGYLSGVRYLVWDTLKEAGIPLVPTKTGAALA